MWGDLGSVVALVLENSERCGEMILASIPKESLEEVSGLG